MKAHMQHTEETIRRLARVQYNTYCQGQKLLSLAISAAFLFAGVLGEFSRTTSLVLIFIGCWSFTEINVPADRNAKKIIDYAKDHFPVSEYQFEENVIRILGDNQETLLSYDDLYSLISDGSYLYLFISKFSAYMVSLEKMEEKNRKELETLLCRRTGRKIEQPGTLLTLNLGTLCNHMRRENIGGKI